MAAPKLMGGAGAKLVRDKYAMTGSTIKIIAAAVMLVDHMGAVVIERILRNAGIASLVTQAQVAQFLQTYGTLYQANQMLRAIGRIAFPLFCFLLVEGFVHTRDIKKYALRLAVFALVSEAPFDFAVSGKWIDTTAQNVFFTLLLGLLIMWGMRTVNICIKYPSAIRIAAQVAIAALGMTAAFALKTDYGAYGVFVILIMLQLRERRIAGAAVGCCVLTAMYAGALPAFLSLIPIGLYNGKRGAQLKYFFYAFYPAHLLALSAVRFWIGIA